MVQIIVGADIEQLMVDWLPGRMAAYGVTGIPVATKAQASESVTVYRTGGPGIVNRVQDQAQLTFDIRRTREGAAERLANLVRGIVLALKDGGPESVLAGYQVYDVQELAGPVNLPDPNYDTGSRYRWSTYVTTRAAIR